MAIRSLILACGMAATLTLAACSGGSSPAAATSPADASSAAIGLLDRLDPAGFPAIAVVVNVRQVRSLLGLPASTPALSSSQDSAQRHYTDLLAAGVPWLNLPYNMPALAAIDFGQVSAAATNGAGREEVVVLATSQPFATFAAALAAHGYTRSGDLLYNPNSSAILAAQISAVAGTPGIIALGNDPAVVQAAAEGRAHGISGPVREALATLSAPAAEAYAATGTCVSAIAISDDISGNAGRLLIRTGTPQAARLTAGHRTDFNPDPPRLDTPTVSGQQLIAPYTYVTPPPTDSFFDALSELPLGQIYQCP